jgi:signal recognition particle receptor subunit beta
VDYFEQRDIPFVVAVNCFDGARRHDPVKVRRALGLGGVAPIVLCDARDRESVKNVLTTLVTYAVEGVPADSHPG